MKRDDFHGKFDWVGPQFVMGLVVLAAYLVCIELFG